MQIQPLHSYFHSESYNKYNLVKVTGYGALATGMLSVVQASRHKFASHKKLAITAVALSFAHLGLIKYFHRK